MSTDDLLTDDDHRASTTLSKQQTSTPKQKPHQHEMKQHAKQSPIQEQLTPSLMNAQPYLMMSVGFLLLLGLSFVYLTNVWLIIFAGILLAVLILSLADMIKKLPIIGDGFAKLPHKLSVGMVVVVLFTSLLGMAYLFGDKLVSQLDELQQALPTAINKLKAYLENMPIINDWLQNNIDTTDISEQPIDAMIQSMSSLLPTSFSGSVANWLQHTPDLIGGMLGAITTFMAIVMMGLFFAISPSVYSRAFLRMIPQDKRPKGKYLLTRSNEALKRWLLGQLLTMSFVGVFTALALYVMGVPFAMALGFLTFLLDFIPVLGPFLAGVPILLVTLLFTPDMIIWVMVLLVVIQQVESMAVSPLVQSRLVDLPPVTLLASQLIMGAFTGILGVALATPLMVLTIVWVQVLYVKFVLKDYGVIILGQSKDDIMTDPYNALPDHELRVDEIKIDMTYVDMEK